MSDQHPLDTSRFSVTAADFKDELDSVLEYVELSGAELKFPTLDDMGIDGEKSEHQPRSEGPPAPP